MAEEKSCPGCEEESCAGCIPSLIRYYSGRFFAERPRFEHTDPPPHWLAACIDKAKRYEKLGAEVGKLVDEKREAYGDSFGRSGAVLRILYPDGIQPAQYDDALAVVRIVDKLFRIANQKEAFGESPYRDIAGYGLLGAAGRSE